MVQKCWLLSLRERPRHGQSNTSNHAGYDKICVLFGVIIYEGILKVYMNCCLGHTKNVCHSQPSFYSVPDKVQFWRYQALAMMI